MLNLVLVVDDYGYSVETSRKRARIAIEYGGGKEDNTQFITPDCLTFEELNFQLSEIEKNIKEIRSKAKRAFA